MCQDDAALSARFFYLPKGLMPAAVFLCSDGVENSYWNEEQLFCFFRGLALTIVENGMEEGISQLAEFLPSMTKKGSGDDVTCSGIIDMTKLSSCSDGIREDLEEASLAAAVTVGEALGAEEIEYDDEELQQVISDVVAEPAEGDGAAEEAPGEQSEISK
jgi:hypothetical protein